MRIVIGENTERAMGLLSIVNYPFTSKLLAASFKRTVIKFHPDVNKHKDANGQTRRIIAAYEALKHLVVDISDEDKERVFRQFSKAEEDIFIVYDTCADCGGLGKAERSHMIPCPDCDPMEPSCTRVYRNERSSGFKTLDCRFCKGTGKFKQRNGRTVDCYKCLGTRKWRTVRCRTCKGSGTVFSSKYETCSTCKGLGKVEVKPFNPVIRKGAIMR